VRPPLPSTKPAPYWRDRAPLNTRRQRPSRSQSQRAILAIVLVATMLDLMDGQITVFAAPSIVRDVDGGESLIKWLGTSYMLTMGTSLVIGGRLGGHCGDRRRYLIGITGFAAASAMKPPTSASTRPCASTSTSSPRAEGRTRRDAHR
jgi:predicted MFS family arabinose efflux permease